MAKNNIRKQKGDMSTGVFGGIFMVVAILTLVLGREYNKKNKIRAG